ncbi:MMPL family transporter [Streptomyces chumphonensis]|uniref:MMPL family transporter n=1 Tax=Streptomyces chumphonensis TaxID=1214925 RepID=A0A927IBM3_9ACTN|nr:MMPL family transporter [Streptomyces chumphonensis]MBD3931157.1 MMPL family transporter [Streptomyces chumphonensis]
MSPRVRPVPRRGPALRALGDAVAARPRRVVWLSVLLTVLAAALAAGTMDRLVLSRFESPASESVRTREVLREEFGTGTPSALLLVTAETGTVDGPRVAAAGRALEAELAARDGVAETASYWSRGGSPAMRAEDGGQALVIARLSGTVTEARAALGDLSPDFTRAGDVVSVRVGGGDEVFRQAAEQARTDFLRAELIVFPLVLLLLFVLYRRWSAAALTLAMGLFSVVATLALLRGVTYVTDVSTFAANLTLVMGVGLGVDYSLFVINRFREELAVGAEVRAAVGTAVARAGRTVVFSGVTVAVSLACLLLFPFPFLRSFAYAGIGTVLTSVFAALVVLPAALARLGHRVTRAGDGAARGPARGWWHRTALRMMRRPLLYGVPALAVLLVVAAPVLGLTFGVPDDRVLPEHTSSRLVQQDIRDRFAAEEMDALQVVHPELAGTRANRAEIAARSLALSRIEGVYQVDALTGSYADGRKIGDPGRSAERFASPRMTWYSVVPGHAALSGDVGDLLADVRAATPGETVRIGGYPAELDDFRAELTDRVPWVLGLVLTTTFALLFLMTGSVLLPVKAMVLNLLSMGVMFGTLVWVFQEGNLAGPLGFTATGTVEPSIPILMFCTAFGLSMDYEVFMLARIKEEYDATGDTRHAVATGLERTGPLITAAAVVLAASFATYAASGIVFLKMLAVGMVVVLLVDATLIRAVLVPVFMRLAGGANWWAPRPLRALPARFGHTATAPAEVAAAPPAAEAPTVRKG